MKRKAYSPEYKTRIVLELLQEELTPSQIASREEINPNQITNWKREFLENATKAFSGNKADKETEKRLEHEQKARARLEKKVGQLTLENDFLKECNEKIHGRGWEDKFGYKS